MYISITAVVNDLPTFISILLNVTFLIHYIEIQHEDYIQMYTLIAACNSEMSEPHSVRAMASRTFL